MAIRAYLCRLTGTGFAGAGGATEAGPDIPADPWRPAIADTVEGFGAGWRAYDLRTWEEFKTANGALLVVTDLTPPQHNTVTALAGVLPIIGGTSIAEITAFIGAEGENESAVNPVARLVSIMRARQTRIRGMR